jgi:hypothetical protein
LHIEIDDCVEFAMLESEILSVLIGTIYDAALDPELWPVALEGIREFVGGCAANFYWQDVSRERAGVFHCVGIDTAYLESYFQTYTRMNPLHPAGGVPDIAAALGISGSTVRTHLKRLFEKTSTHRQVDLVKLVASHASPFS